MKPGLRESERLRLLAEWYHSPLGAQLARQEQACLERMLGEVFGYYLLQIGIEVGFSAVLAASRIRHRILLPPVACSATLGRQVASRPEQLPVATDSIDAVFLPHTLDFASDPHGVLREVERVLIPEGRVLIIGFNALSFWGLWRLVPRGANRVPWCGEFRTPFRVTDWLTFLGFQVEFQEMLMFRPPWPRILPDQLAVLDSLGKRFWPALGSVYALRAVKRVSTLTPMRPSWRRHKLLPGRAIEPTARDGSHV